MTVPAARGRQAEGLARGDSSAHSSGKELSPFQEWSLVPMRDPAERTVLLVISKLEVSKIKSLILLKPIPNK